MTVRRIVISPGATANWRRDPTVRSKVLRKLRILSERCGCTVQLISCEETLLAEVPYGMEWTEFDPWVGEPTQEIPIVMEMFEETPTLPHAAPPPPGRV